MEDVVGNGGESPMGCQDFAALARSRSQVYGFLATAYNCLPDDQFVRSLSDPELAAFVASSAEAEDLDEESREGWRLIDSFSRASRDRSEEEIKTELAVERTRLLRGIKRGYGPPPPYEGVYAETAQEALGLAMVNVRNFYAESGVVLPEEAHDQPDFIGFELDFMRFLTAKEAGAWTECDLREALAVAEKEQAFLEKHINTWVPRFCDLMFKEAQWDFYKGIALLTKGFVQGDVYTTGELVAEVRSMQAA